MKKYVFLMVLLFGCLGIKAQTELSGDYTITGQLQVGDNLDVTNEAANTVKSVLARLPEETSLEVKAFNTQPQNGKLFSIENYFYYGRNKNSAINFWRGAYEWGGFITIDVNEGTPICKFSYRGLDVYGILQAQEIIVSNSGWADFVFADSYQLPSLMEVKQHISENKHLPGIPSEAEVKENGTNLGEMQVKLLQKIEELTLYVIQQQETIDVLNMKVEKLENVKDQ
jgi:hypothetical protein